VCSAKKKQKGSPYFKTVTRNRTGLPLTNTSILCSEFYWSCGQYKERVVIADKVSTFPRLNPLTETGNHMSTSLALTTQHFTQNRYLLLSVYEDYRSDQY
jgi:hypothetical protein